MEKSKEMLAIREAVRHVARDNCADRLDLFVQWAKVCGHLQVQEAYGNFVRFINGST